MIRDAWEEIISVWLDEPDMLDGKPPREKGKIKTTDVLMDALNFDKKHIGRREELRIGRVMKALGYEKKKERINGKPEWCFIPKVPF